MLFAEVHNQGSALWTEAVRYPELLEEVAAGTENSSNVHYQDTSAFHSFFLATLNSAAGGVSEGGLRRGDGGAAASAGGDGDLADWQALHARCALYRSFVLSQFCCSLYAALMELGLHSAPEVWNSAERRGSSSRRHEALRHRANAARDKRVAGARVANSREESPPPPPRAREREESLWRDLEEDPFVVWTLRAVGVVIFLMLVVLCLIAYRDKYGLSWMDAAEPVPMAALEDRYAHLKDA